MAVVTPTHAANERTTGILEAACRVIVADGAHDLRMGAVAELAGVSKALVHYYFSTRQELMHSAFAFSVKRWHAAVEAELVGAATGRERVERLLLAGVESDLPFSEQKVLWNEVWSSLRSDDDLRPLVEASYRESIARIVDLIDEGRADESIPWAVDATAAGWRLVAVGDGLDSLLYLGLIEGDRVGELLLGAIRRELDEPGSA
jgi:AcrR family transcriptional regulator